MARKILGVVAAIMTCGTPVWAQVDPLLFLKTATPNVIFVVETSNRMQRNAATDPTTTATTQATSSYYDPWLYTRTGAAWEAGLGVNALSTTIEVSPSVRQPDVCQLRQRRQVRLAGDSNHGRPQRRIQPLRGADAPVGCARRAVSGGERKQVRRALRARQDAAEPAWPSRRKETRVPSRTLISGSR